MSSWGTFSLSPAWSGDLASGDHYVELLKRLGTPVAAHVENMTHSVFIALFDPYSVNGRPAQVATRTVSTSSPGVVAALLEAGNTKSSSLSAVSMHHLHGAATRVPLQDTAFGTRDEHIMIEIVTTWDDGDEGLHRAWGSKVSADLAPQALPGGYPNLLPPEAHDQIAHAYGPNAARLRSVKAAYDADRVFEAIPLPLDPPHQA